MKIRNLILSVLICICGAACTSGENDTNSADTLALTDTTAGPIAGEITSLCFIRTEGTSKQDTTSVEIVVEDGKVTGQMYWHPFEKDSRRGELSGVMNGDTVNAVWTFMQEGMQDTMAVQFLVKDNSLMQKPLMVNTKTGRQQTDNNADFTAAYRPSVDLKKK